MKARFRAIVYCNGVYKYEIPVDPDTGKLAHRYIATPGDSLWIGVEIEQEPITLPSSPVLPTGFPLRK